MNAGNLGILYLIPTPLGPPGNGIPLADVVLRIVQTLDGVIAESKKSVGPFLRKILVPARDISMRLLNEHTRRSELDELIAPILKGERWGLMSDAGCPAVADPGSLLVRLAHENGIRVSPQPGPSSILMALMASGLNGQRFAFHGYLSKDAGDRRRQIRDMETDSLKYARTQIWMETPYRNTSLLADILATLHTETLLCIAADLTCETEEISTHPVGKWRVAPPNLKNRPAIFLIGHPSTSRMP